MSGVPKTYSLAEANQLSPRDFEQTFAAIVEHSSWVAAAVAKQRPFANLESLVIAFKQILVHTEEKRAKEILNFHPALSGKEAEQGNLTDFSKQEQAGLGLNELRPEDFKRIQALNQTYFHKFGFPFVICVGRLKNLDELFSLWEFRLKQPAQTELKQAMLEVGQIAEIRLGILVEK